MIRKIKYLIPAVLLFTACKRQLDINSDPNNPTTVAVSRLLPTTEKYLSNSLAMGATNGGLSQVLETYMHRTVVREDPNQYGASGDNFNIGNNWTNMYITVMTNVDAIIAQASAAGNTKYAGIAEIIKAYGYSQMVDTYGDVPFSQVNQLLSNNVFNAKFDKGSDIYPALFTLLDKGIADLSNTSASNRLSPGTDDLIYGGSTAKWIKAANSIKFKLLVQQRLIKNVAADVNALITANNMISQTSEDFVLPYGPNGATDDRNPGFEDYFASQRGNYISPWFYEILKGYNPGVNTNNPDPRMPYYFFKQLTANGTPTNPTEYRDGGFVSIYFGSLGVNAAQIQQNNMTVLGIYPVGGKYDDGKGGVVSASSGTGAAPYRFITYADVLFLKAELMQAGIITGNARTTLQAAVTEAFKQVDYVVTNYVKPSQAVPPVSGTTAATTYINNVLTEYDAPHYAAGYPGKSNAGTGNLSEKQMEIIMTQKWISSFGSAVDAYTDYRRTGYPVLFDPNNAAIAPNGKAQPPVAGDPLNNPQPAVPVQASKKFPLTLPWYTQELQTNANAPKQKTDPSTYKPFWLP